jgi:hypothetical protein
MPKIHHPIITILLGAVTALAFAPLQWFIIAAQNKEHFAASYLV